MKPYYDEDGITIYHADCRDVLPDLPKADLMLTDPPYGVGWQSGYREQKFPILTGDDDCTLDVVNTIGSMLPSLKENRHMYIFGNFDFSSLPSLERSCELIWDKAICGMGNLEIPWGPQHERITFAIYKPIKRQRLNGALSVRLRKGSIIRVPRLNADAVINHPTEKPVLLLRQLIESSSVIGDLVLDPFMGVGSTLVAARIEGRKAIGIEIEERYCEIAAQRLAQRCLSFEYA